MAEEKNPTGLATWAKEKFQNLNSEIQMFVVASRLWHQKFTEAEHKLLGGNVEKAFLEYNGTAGMWQKVKGGTLPRAIVDVARTLGIILETDYQSLLDVFEEHMGNSEITNAIITNAIIEKHLVLIEYPHEVYWNGEMIDVDWNHRTALWELLYLLIRNRLRNRPISYKDFGEHTPKRTIADRKNKLLNLENFPDDLGCKIDSTGNGQYKLNLELKQIRIFERKD